MKLATPLDFLQGYYILSAIDNTCAVRCLHSLDIVVSASEMRGGIVYYRICREEFDRLGEAKHYFEIHKYCGLPAIFSRYRKRPGILIGAVLFAAILQISTLFIWRMDITGNVKIDEREISAALAEQGCTVGSFMPTLDCFKICNRILIKNDSLAWLTVNLRGTTAFVQLRERVPPELSEDDVYGIAPANMVAARAGVVTAVEVLGGKAVVAAGQYVERGQLVIAGVFTNRYEEVMVTRAKGSCYAQTMDIIEAECAYLSTAKVETGEKARDISLIIFGKTLNLRTNRFTNGEKYDMIETASPLVIFGEIELPITVVTRDYTFWRDEPYTLSTEEARAMAWDELYEKINARFGKAEILSRETIESADTNAYRIRCEIFAVEDIALSTAME